MTGGTFETSRSRGLETGRLQNNPKSQINVLRRPMWLHHPKEHQPLMRKEGRK